MLRAYLARQLRAPIGCCWNFLRFETLSNAATSTLPRGIEFRRRPCRLKSAATASMDHMISRHCNRSIRCLRSNRAVRRKPTLETSVCWAALSERRMAVWFLLRLACRSETSRPVMSLRPMLALAVGIIPRRAACCQRRFRNREAQQKPTRFGFICGPEPRYFNEPCRVENELAAFVNSLPHNHKELTEALTALGATCAGDLEKPIDCVYRKRTRTSGWITGEPTPRWIMDDIFAFRITTAREEPFASHVELTRTVKTIK
jgi:hypothetical protein